MRLATVLAGAHLAGATAAVAAQEPQVERLRELVVRDDRPALLGAVRERPGDSRELVRRLLVETAANPAAGAESTLTLAGRVAAAHAAVWGDSFPLGQVARFRRMSAAERAAKASADSVRRAGNVALGRAGVDVALALWREALRRSSASADTAGVAAALGNIGVGFYRASALDSATAYLERSRQLAESVGDQVTALNALGALGSVAKDRGDLARAQQVYARALSLRTRVGDVRGAAADHNNLGLLAAALGEIDAARAHYENALALARRHALAEAAAAALVNLGNAASADASYAEAGRRYGEALATYRTLGRAADVALVLHNLGLLALRRGDYRTAQARLSDALHAYERTGSRADAVQARRDLAAAAAAAGDLGGALRHLRAAERAVARLPAAPELAAGVALARADLSEHLNAPAEAERQYRRAEALYRAARNVAGQAEAQHGRAMLLVQRRQYARALELLRAAARAQAAAGARRGAALTHLAIGHVQLRQGDPAGARRSAEQALDSLRTLGDAVGEAGALGALGALELGAGAPLAAEQQYRRGLARLEGRPAAAVSWELRAGLARALRARGALAAAADELRRAAADVERAAGTLALEERRAAFLADKRDVYAQLALVEHARGDAAAAFAAAERMRSGQVVDLLARGRVAGPPAADSSLVEREQDLRRQIAELARRLEEEERGPDALRGPGLGGAASAVTREALARAQEQYQQLLLELREDATPHAPIVRAEVAPWRAVAERLSPGEAMLEYLVSDSTTLAFVVRRDTLQVVDLNVGRRALETLVDFARGTLIRPPPAAPPDAAHDGAWRAPLRRLHAHLLAPLEAAGALEGVRRLVVVPHVELHYLPFGALLRDGAGRRREFAVERYEIGYAPSATAWVRLAKRRPTPAAARVLALAPRTSALPGSRAEVEAIRALHGPRATVLTGGEASETAFRAEAPRHDVVHLATYGVLNKHNPLFSFVELAPAADADGRLEVHEVFGLALDARLVVLSACQTALASGTVSDVPAGDDWVGLVRAFLGVGARNVIATLWPVEDRSTARLMTRLHRGLRSGQSEITALAEAQREALRNPATADPFYWAGFILVGGR